MPKAGCTSGRRSSSRLRAILSILPALAPLVCLNPCFAQAANRVTAVRSWSAGDTTRVAVEISGEFKYKSDNLETPPRLFLGLSKHEVLPCCFDHLFGHGLHLVNL